MRIDYIPKHQWDKISQDAHIAVFEESRPPHMNRMDYALGMARKDQVIGFVTVRELDHESIYWQYGGSLPVYRGTPVVFKLYRMALEYCFDRGTNYISTVIENTNIRMLKMALKVGFIIIGTKNFGGKVYLDLILERENYKKLGRK